MVLDFDNGQLSPDQFIDMFWTSAGTARKRSFLICNSFSRSADQPNRFRVVLFYRCPATSVAQHQAVYDAIVQRLADAGLTETAAGLDRTCRSGIQSFYMPCTNRAHPDWALFKVFGTKTKELEKYGIDPELYEKTAAPVWASEPTRPRPEGDEQTSIPLELEALVTEIGSRSEGRHQLVWELAKKLAFHFRSRRIVEAHLARAAGSDRKLQKKARDAINSLQGYRVI